MYYLAVFFADEPVSFGCSLSRWLNFERVIEALVAERIYHINLEQLQRYAREECFIVDEYEFTTLVNFYHDIGLIIKHCSTVVLKAQWLIDLFKQLITIPPFHKTVRNSAKLYSVRADFNRRYNFVTCDFCSSRMRQSCTV